VGRHAVRMLLLMMLLSTTNLHRPLCAPSPPDPLVAGMLTGYESVCYDVFRGSPPNKEAAGLIQLIAKAGASDDGHISREEAGSKWVWTKLHEFGFERDPATDRLAAPPDVLERLVRDQNAARMRVHQEAAASREELLTVAIEALGQKHAAWSGEIGGAREALRHFSQGAGKELAAGPFLLGVAVLLREQATSQETQVWTCARATFLNGGDSFCEQVGEGDYHLLWPPLPKDVAAGGGGAVSHQLPSPALPSGPPVRTGCVGAWRLGYSAIRGISGGADGGRRLQSRCRPQTPFRPSALPQSAVTCHATALCEHVASMPPACGGPEGLMLLLPLRPGLDESAWVVSTAAWTAAELRAIAGVAERQVKRIW
jgi:hypothetical protein